jgi:ABC-type cobalamin/Fe3+-siderophores transport system ATPase subunit
VTFSKSTKANIFKILIAEWHRIFNNESGDEAIELLSTVWDLHEMSSTDNRYDDAYGDIIQHYFRNNDWETDYLFTDRLDLFGEGTDFKSFVESFLSPRYYTDANHLIGVSAQVDAELRREKLRLVIEEYNEFGFPIQKIYALEDAQDLPTGVAKNNVPFYVIKDNSINPKDQKYFSLTPNKGWNDYSVVSIFTLAIHDKDGWTNLGRTKIIHETELITWEHLPDKFFHLPDEFCSLSSSEEFYFALRSHFKDHGMIAVLFALQDAAYFPDIHDRYSRNSNFKDSLLRSDVAERLLRELKPRLQGANMERLYSFDYRFKPAYSDIPVKISFDFNNTGELPNRIYAIIGKNGTGKTQLMTGLPNSFSKNDPKDFFQHIPSFSKIIAVSYSVFDSYPIPRKNATFNYVYCGLKDDEGDMRSSRGLVLSFHHNWKKIEEMGRTSKWRSVIRNFIEKEVLDAFIIKSEDSSKEYKVSLEGYNTIKTKLSSGQSILLYIITQVVANIRLDSLILYDEPETHLHPNAIVELMNTIYELVEEFESYCLIATHSPLVIRELFSKNVFVLERLKNMPSIRRIGVESFGENLGILTDEVFGDREVDKQYKTIIQQLIRKGKTFEQIVELFEFDEVPLSLNARIYIKNFLKRRNEKS